MLELLFTPFPTLTTDRLMLREIQHTDKNEIFFLRSEKEVMKYLDKLPAQSIDEAVEFIDRISTSQKNNDGITWCISLKDSPTLIGTICFWQITKEHLRAEIGYVLHPRFHGKGIMQEAMTAVLKYGFEAMKLHSVEAKVNPNNAASIKLLENNGFVREGYFKEDYFFNGKFLDTGVYSLLTPIK